MKLRSLGIIFAFTLFCNFKYAFAQEHKGSSQQKARVITISQGIRMVLKDSRLIKTTIPEDEMAYQDSLSARSVLLPHFNISATKTYKRYQEQMKSGSLVLPVADKDPFSFGFDVYQTLFDFGKGLSNYRASKDMWKAAQAHTESVRRVATLEFIVAYFDLLESEKMTTVAKTEVESLSSYLSDLEHLFEEGVIVKNELLPAKVRLADAKQKFIVAQNNSKLAEAHLNNILSLPLRENIAVKDIKIDLKQIHFPDIEDAWTASKVNRPEVAFYEDQINASVSSAKAKAKENLPVVFIGGGYSYAQNQYQVHQDNVSVNLGVKMNLFDGGATKAEVSKERLRTDKLNEQKDKLVEDIKFEVEDSFFGLKNAYDKVQVAKDALDQADENVRFYRVKYNVGSATSTDVLEAITLQTVAQTNYFNADYELKRNYAKLMYSMGEDLVSIYDKMENEKNDITK